MHKTVIREISDAIVAAQGPIRVLDSIKWDDQVRETFFAKGANQLPNIDAGYYSRNTLGFSVADCRSQFKRLISRIQNELDLTHPVSRLMHKSCYEYLGLLDLIEARGTPEFYRISKNLYGYTQEPFHSKGPNLNHLGDMLAVVLQNIDRSMFLEKFEKTIAAPEAVSILHTRLQSAFAKTGRDIFIMESDGIIADAAAGSNYIKLNKNSKFSMHDIRVLEVHEGWVHLGTTLNGENQSTCSFLSKGTPSCTVTQEGLAVFMEIISFCSHPARLQRIGDRIRAINMAEQGADFLDVYRKLIGDGREAEEAYTIAMRTFRGSTPTGKPFTKDLSYTKGFIDVYNFIRLAVKRGKLYLIELLFCGKLAISEMETIAIGVKEGLIDRPVFLPPSIADLNALTAWMAFSNFLNRLDLKQIEQDFESVFEIPTPSDKAP